MAWKQVTTATLLLLAGAIAVLGVVKQIADASILSFIIACFACLILVTLLPRSIHPKSTAIAGNDLTAADPMKSKGSKKRSNGADITDPITGLMNESFFSGIVGPKVATARRRLWPVSIVLLHVMISPTSDTEGTEDEALASFSSLIITTIRESDVACRIGPRTFALILDDTDEDGGAWAAERIQLAQARLSDRRILKVSAGVASYPSHGIEPTEILSRAKEALERATSNADLPGLGLVIVAPQSPL